MPRSEKMLTLKTPGKLPDTCLRHFENAKSINNMNTEKRNPGERHRKYFQYNLTRRFSYPKE